MIDHLQPVSRHASYRRRPANPLPQGTMTTRRETSPTFSSGASPHAAATSSTAMNPIVLRTSLLWRHPD